MTQGGSPFRSAADAAVAALLDALQARLEPATWPAPTIATDTDQAVVTWRLRGQVIVQVSWSKEYGYEVLARQDDGTLAGVFGSASPRLAALVADLQWRAQRRRAGRRG